MVGFPASAAGNRALGLADLGGGEGGGPGTPEQHGCEPYPKRRCCVTLGRFLGVSRLGCLRSTGSQARPTGHGHLLDASCVRGSVVGAQGPKRELLLTLMEPTVSREDR